MKQGGWVETQWDGLVGPTHHYAGLGHGNVASHKHALSVSNPRAAALQGLEKMRMVAELGIPQFIVPPPERPNNYFLQAVGLDKYTGALEGFSSNEQRLISAAWSAAYIWRANMATVTPACDTIDGQLHITPANLLSTLHRPQEASENYLFLSKIFQGNAVVHGALPSSMMLADEGAANHMRFSGGYGQAGVQVWVYGRAQGLDVEYLPKKFQARQTLEACQALARLHHVPSERIVFVKQTAEAIDAGVFHNDVIAMSNQNVLIYHEKAFDDVDVFLEDLRQKLAPIPLNAFCISEQDLPLSDAVASYFFNSQLLGVANGQMVVIAPSECLENKNAKAVFDRLLADENCPIQQVYYPELRESMKNGGGPACLRLRIEMDDEMVAKMPQNLRWTPQLHVKLNDFIQKNYPNHVEIKDVMREGFALECRSILQGLYGILL